MPDRELIEPDRIIIPSLKSIKSSKLQCGACVESFSKYDFDESLIFHSGTKSKSGNLYTSGGRVMCVTTLSEDLNQALEKSLKVCSKINFDGKYYRKDIGRDLIKY